MRARDEPSALKPEALVDINVLFLSGGRFFLYRRVFLKAEPYMP